MKSSMSQPLISASILSADFSHLADQIRQAELAGTDWIHIDIMDGHFVPNITMGPFIVETCRRITTLPLDVHLMIEKPENHIEAFAKAGADRISVHIEGSPNIHRVIQFIRNQGASPGIVLNPGTPVVSVEEVLPFVDLILVMTVNPGFSGQVHLPEMTQKISTFRRVLDQRNLHAILQVDGGITADNIASLARAGASCFVAATSIFKHPNGISAGIQALRFALTTSVHLSLK
jgi:ribulose-phosphate 3-epimerase